MPRLIKNNVTLAEKILTLVMLLCILAAVSYLLSLASLKLIGSELKGKPKIIIDFAFLKLLPVASIVILTMISIIGIITGAYYDLYGSNIANWKDLVEIFSWDNAILALFKLGILLTLSAIILFIAFGMIYCINDVYTKRKTEN